MKRKIMTDYWVLSTLNNWRYQFHCWSIYQTYIVAIKTWFMVTSVTFNSLTTNVLHHIETSRLICISNQLMEEVIAIFITLFITLLKLFYTYNICVCKNIIYSSLKWSYKELNFPVRKWSDVLKYTWSKKYVEWKICNVCHKWNM